MRKFFKKVFKMVLGVFGQQFLGWFEDPNVEYIAESVATIAVGAVAYSVDAAGARALGVIGLLVGTFQKRTVSDRSIDLASIGSLQGFGHMVKLPWWSTLFFATPLEACLPYFGGRFFVYPASFRAGMVIGRLVFRGEVSVATRS